MFILRSRSLVWICDPGHSRISHPSASAAIVALEWVGRSLVVECPFLDRPALFQIKATRESAARHACERYCITICRALQKTVRL